MTQMRKWSGAAKPKAKREKRATGRQTLTIIDETHDQPGPVTAALEDCSGLTYAKLRTKAKELGLSAKGTAAAILERIKNG